MTMNIKDEEVHRLARDLADRTGQSMTQVVREALAEYDAKLKIADSEERFVRALRALEGSGARSGLTNQEADAMLYDSETGMPI
jgi:antitoxin VapB